MTTTIPIGSIGRFTSFFTGGRQGHALAIAARFNANFAMPSTLALPHDEEEAFMLLRAFALNEPLELNRFTPTLIKSPENATIVPQQFRDESVLRLEHENATAVLFDNY